MRIIYKWYLCASNLTVCLNDTINTITYTYACIIYIYFQYLNSISITYLIHTYFWMNTHKNNQNSNINNNNVLIICLYYIWYVNYCMMSWIDLLWYLRRYNEFYFCKHKNNMRTLMHDILKGMYVYDLSSLGWDMYVCMINKILSLITYLAYKIFIIWPIANSVIILFCYPMYWRYFLKQLCKYMQLYVNTKLW